MTAIQTLAELAITHPAASRVFQRHGLDYCCGGHTLLADVCRVKGLDPAAILEEIVREDARLERPHWDMVPIPDLIRYVVTEYHAPLRTELPSLIALAEQVESQNGDTPGCPRGLSAHLAQVHGAIVDHLAKEEKVLFPLILEGYGARTAGPVRVLELEHDEHSRNLARIRELTNNLTPPHDASPAWRTLYQRLGRLESALFEHMHLENNVLFPRALNE
jgi:regulator of cell morphogenesis and NO signaling